MAIADQVTEQMKQAMKARDERRLAALRSMRTAFLNEMKKDGSTSIPDAVCEGCCASSRSSARRASRRSRTPGARSSPRRSGRSWR